MPGYSFQHFTGKTKKSKSAKRKKNKRSKRIHVDKFGGKNK